VFTLRKGPGRAEGTAVGVSPRADEPSSPSR
jgi:hypothetical protein